MICGLFPLIRVAFVCYTVIKAMDYGMTVYEDCTRKRKKRKRKKRR